MRGALTYIGLFMLLLAGISCSDKEFEDPSADNVVSGEDIGNVVEVPCEFIVSPLGGAAVKGIEEYTGNELAINDFWLLQFGQPTDGEDGSRPFLSAIYHTPDWGTGRVQMSESHLQSTGMVWIVANIGKTDVNGRTFFSDYSGKTLSYFYNDGVPLSEISQLKTLNGGNPSLADRDAGLAVPRSGSSYFDVADLSGVDGKKALTVNLKSILAKLTVDVSAVENIRGIKLMRVPSKASYAPEKSDETSFRLLTYDYDIPVPSGKVFTLYIPQNKPAARTASQTQASSGTSLTKTANAPGKAMYISLAVEHSNTPLAINIFPGSDEKTYDILANTHYRETVSASSSAYSTYLADSKGDSRLVEKVVQEATSNCYMIHPIYQGSKSNLYSTVYREEAYMLPFVERVNEAWQSSNSSKCIGASDEWIVHLLWQDEAKRLIYLAESSGLPAWDNRASGAPDYATEYFGRGQSDVCIVPVRSSGSNYTRGNVVLALRKKDSGGSYTAGNGEKYGDILWSWHLWVTDYQPDDAGAYTSGYYKDVKGVSGSKVFHFKDWSSIYAWIMDRNLGAKGWEPPTVANSSLSMNQQTSVPAKSSSYGTFYQWGRKDPFPGRGVATTVNVNTAALYDIAGNKITNPISSSSTAVNMSDLHSRPTVLSSNINYAGVGAYWAWDDINEKSLYDPCPPGWIVPSTNVYGPFVKNRIGITTTNLNEAYCPRDDDGRTGDRYGYGFKNFAYSDYEAFAVNPSGGASTSTPPIYFPASGFVQSSGKRDLGGICDLWTLEQKAANTATYLYIGKALGTNYDGKRGWAIVHIQGEKNANDDPDHDSVAYFGKHNAFGMRCVKTAL